MIDDTFAQSYLKLALFWPCHKEQGAVTVIYHKEVRFRDVTSARAALAEGGAAD